MQNQDKLQKAFETDSIMEYPKWREEIPFINFPSYWQVKIIPPSSGAIVRFLVKKDNARVSIYLDCYDLLGSYGEPYWEIYPVGEDVMRVQMNDVDGLLEAINTSITEQNS